MKKSHIELSERKLLLRIVDVIIIIISLFFGFKYFELQYVNFNHENIILWIITLSVYTLLLGEIFQLYNLNVSNNRFQVVRSIFVTTFFLTLLYIFTPVIAPSLPENRVEVLYFFLVITFSLIIWRFLYIGLLFSPKYFKTIILIGHSSRLKKILPLIANYKLHNVAQYISNEKIIDFDNHLDINTVKVKEIIDKSIATEIVVSSSGFSSEVTKKLNQELILLFEEGINIKSFETYYEEITDRVPKEYLNHDFYKKITFSKHNSSGLYLFLLRSLDIIVSFIGILLFLFVIPFVFIGNLFGNKGPLFYGQERVGKRGESFRIYKLRSMVTDAEKNGAVWAKKNDARITKFGRFLRLTRLDEVPQFYNILKGDMSLIGPRPERPEFVKDLEKKIPFYAIRHVVRPGLTGWAQVNYPYANTIEEQETKLRYDLFYIKERSAFLDFKILIKTISTVLFFKGQ